MHAGYSHNIKTLPDKLQRTVKALSSSSSGLTRCEFDINNLPCLLSRTSLNMLQFLHLSLEYQKVLSSLIDSSIKQLLSIYYEQIIRKVFGYIFR